MRAVWLLQRDLPVPNVLLAETKGANEKAPSITDDGLPLHPWSAYDNLVSSLCKRHPPSDFSSAHHQQKPSGHAPVTQSQTTLQDFVQVVDGVVEVRSGAMEELGWRRAGHMRGHMERRRTFLAHVPTANMPPHIADRIDTERRLLELYALQQEVREGLRACHVDAGIPAPHAMHLLKSSNTRLDSTVIKEESKEEWEERTREAEEQSKMNRRKAFLQDMQQTQRNFMREHESIRRSRETICKAVKGWHRQAEKSKQKERSDRLLALKSNDFDKYREFVKEAKNERLMELIDKTDNYLSSLAAKMSKTSKMLSGAADAKTESLLELHHQILPLDDSQGNHAQPNGQSTTTKGPEEEGAAKAGNDVTSAVDAIFANVKNSQVSFSRPLSTALLKRQRETASPQKTPYMGGTGQQDGAGHGAD